MRSQPLRSRCRLMTRIGFAIVASASLSACIAGPMSSTYCPIPSRASGSLSSGNRTLWSVSPASIPLTNDIVAVGKTVPP